MDFNGYTDFNSHAHVERDFTLAEKSVRFIISTHTLTWSVTPQLKMITTGQWISTHTLTWSVTVNTTLPVTNSQISTHTLTWSVTDYVLAVEFVLFISTHTLTWSVTKTSRDCTVGKRFQLTRSRGA